MRTRLPTLAGGLFVLLTLGAMVASIVLEVALGADRRAADGVEPGWVSGLAGLALAVPGALLARTVPRNPVAWILCVTGLHWAADGTCAEWASYATAQDPWLPGATVTWWLYQRLGASLLFSLPLLLVFYPDGRPPAGRWRWAAYVSLGCTAILPLTLLFVPARIAGAEDAGPLAHLSADLLSIPLPDSVWTVLLRIGYAALPLSLLVPFVVVFRRYRQASGLAKTRMRWLVWAGVVDVLVMLSALLLPQSALSLGLVVAIVVTGGAIAIGILRPRLVDIDRLLGGTVLYGALATLVVAVDAVLLAAATTLLGEQGAALAGLLVVMLVYGPLRHRLWQLVQRVVLGRRHDPYRVVSGLAEQLERTDSPEDQLLAVARSVAEAFNAPYVAVEVHRGGDSTLLAEHGTAVRDTQTLPITYRGETVGRLILPAGVPAPCCRRGTSGSSRTWSGRPRPRPGPATSPPSCSTAGNVWSGRARRSAAGSAATCTTASVRRSAGWRCASTPPATCLPLRRRGRTRCCGRPARTCRPPSPMCGAWCTTCVRRPSTTWD
ncbi:hypothetical protein GCM10027610_003910 [Dactylosporangium cerinum]